MKLIYLHDCLKKKNIQIFSTTDLRRLLGLSESAAYRLLWNYEKKGYVVPLKRGLYALKDFFPSSYLIANKLYQPSYLSFDTALSYHGIIPESIYTLTSATTMITREFTVNGIVYAYHRIKKEAYTGYKPVSHQNTVVFIAEPEKALADYLYFVALKRRELHYERMSLKKINRRKLLNYIKLFQRPTMLRWMEKIYADFGKPSRIY